MCSLGTGRHNNRTLPSSQRGGGRKEKHERRIWAQSSLMVVSNPTWYMLQKNSIKRPTRASRRSSHLSWRNMLQSSRRDCRHSEDRKQPTTESLCTYTQSTRLALVATERHDPYSSSHSEDSTGANSCCDRNEKGLQLHRKDGRTLLSYS